MKNSDDIHFLLHNSVQCSASSVIIHLLLLNQNTGTRAIVFLVKILVGLCKD